MKERPILFNGLMVRALLDGSKTQTRRVVKPSRDINLGCNLAPHEIAGEINAGSYLNSPYGQPGDRLWVRETFSSLESFDFFDSAVPDDVPCQWYWADGNPEWGDWTRPTASIHMPRATCRIFLEITDVRVERLNDISEDDADAEGCERLDSGRCKRDLKLCPKCGGTSLHRALGPNGTVIEDVDCRECDTYIKRYRFLWESIYDADSWSANPWVWVIEFKKVAP